MKLIKYVLLIPYVLMVIVFISCTQEEVEQIVPSKPVLLTPTNNELDVNKAPHFTWEPSTINNGNNNTITYKVYIWTQNNPKTLIAENLTETTFNDYPNDLTQLATGETYYWEVRAKDTQSTLEVTSETWSFTITDCPTLTFDGQTYTTRKIGNHRWLRQNLNSDNHPIGISRCFEDEAYNCSAYGRLYDWHAAMSIADQIPGWHLPTDEEWQDLELALGMTSAAMLNATGFRGEISPQVGKQLKVGGSSGFEARLAGAIYIDPNTNESNHSSLGFSTSFWTATTATFNGSDNYAFRRRLQEQSSAIDRSYGNSIKDLRLYSVRLIKD